MEALQRGNASQCPVLRLSLLLTRIDKVGCL
jgi:hypothetical protein